MKADNEITSTSQGKWTQVRLAGHECDVYEPPVVHPNGYAAIYLHGVHLSTLHDKMEFLREFDRHGLRMIAPRTGRSWWSDRICTEFDPQISAEAYVVKHVVPYAAERWKAVPPQLGLFGTSMGGQGALRIAFRHPNIFPVVAAISPAIDYQLRWDDEGGTLRTMYRDAEEVRQDTAILHVHPLNWPRNIWFCCDPTDLPWHDSADRLRMKLSAIGIPHVAELEIEHGGHGFQYYGRMAEQAIGFMVDRLEAERRRVE